LRNTGLKAFALRHHLDPVQAALAWLLAKDDIIAIPKTSHRTHLRENHGALDVGLSATQLAELDQLFAPPAGPTPLEML